MKRFFLTAAALMLAAVAFAQNNGFVSVPLSTDSFSNRHITAFEKANYQGMDCYKNYVVSLQHTGIATVWKYDGKDGLAKLGGFKLATHDPVNHSNVCSFGVEKAAPRDPMPVIYVSQCHKQPYKGRKDVLFVERILPGFQGSDLVQTIHFDDVDQLYGYALQWVVDRRHKVLYGFGNTTKDKDVEGNRHRVIKFRLPRLSEGDVVFTKDDIIDTYVVEDHGLAYATIGQGLCIWKDKLMMPTGLGTPEYPSYLFVWDLKNKRPVEVLDMSIGTTGELEDLAHFKCRRFLVQGQDGLFEMKYKK
ncbi:MAG: hypothetical protein J6S97_09740 [Bacteroidales bacterium]|nr:hypothetical protein [Bacteroidales bacterium]